MSFCGLNRTKINKILNIWQQNVVGTSAWFEANKIYYQLVASYERSHWIQKIGNGAYIRDGDHVQWQGGLYAIQKQLSSLNRWAI